MKQSPTFIRFETENGPTWGIADGERARTMSGDPFSAWQTGPVAGSLESVDLLAPVNPSKIICVGRNYVAHAEEHDAEVPQEPLLFFKPPSSVIGSEAPILLPPQTEQVEHECELAVVIGRRCRNVTPERAWDYVLGITCGNDVTARDLQRRDNQWTRAKGFDTFCPLGPWIVTRTTEADVNALTITTRVNGDVRQQGKTQNMVFSPAELIAYVSQIMTLEPGDVIMTGTPAGVGPLEAGDVVEIEIDQIGVLRNPVEAS